MAAAARARCGLFRRLFGGAQVTYSFDLASVLFSLVQVTYLAWNCKVQHILASTSVKGTTIVWDLKRQKPVISFTDPNRCAAEAGRDGVRVAALGCCRTDLRLSSSQQPSLLGTAVESGGAFLPATASFSTPITACATMLIKHRNKKSAKPTLARGVKADAECVCRVVSLGGPQVATQLIVASDDDRSPSLQA